MTAISLVFILERCSTCKFVPSFNTFRTHYCDQVNSDVLLFRFIVFPVRYLRYACRALRHPIEHLKNRIFLGTEIAIAEKRRDNTRNMRWRAIMIHDERPQMKLHRTFDPSYSIVFLMFPLFLLAKGISRNTIKSSEFDRLKFIRN